MSTPCWNCQAETQKAPLCPQCGKVQPQAPGATHFTLFGLPPTVDLDVGKLEQSYRDLSLKLHPDRQAGQDAKLRRYSLEQTTALNDAYKTLKDPLKRAYYLLKLQGQDLDKEDAGAQKNMPLSFLEEVMELREALEGLKRQKDLTKAQAMAEDVQTRQREALKEGQTALSTRLSNGSDQHALDTAAHALARVRYFTRFLEEVERMEEEALAT